MRASELADLVLEAVTDVGGWDTPPVAVWFPDFESKALKEAGLTAIVIVPGQTTELQTRRTRTKADAMLHVAVTKPMVGTPAQQFADGATVVDQAEDVVDALLGVRITGEGDADHFAACLKAQHEPIIAPEIAKQYALWCAYLKLTFLSGD